jgi:hypothetical protein
MPRCCRMSGSCARQFPHRHRGFPDVLVNRRSLNRGMKRLIIAAAAFVIVSAHPALTQTAAAAKKTTKPKIGPGLVCKPLGAHAAGTSLDCVRNGSKLQWQPKGSKLNPYRVGETFEWTQSSDLNNPGALISTCRLTVSEFLPDASGWISGFPDNQPQDVFNAANGARVRGIRMTYTLVSATDASSRNFGSLTTLWLGDDRAAGCCTQGTLQWGNPPLEAIDAYTRLDDGQSRTGVAVFAVAEEALGKRPLLRVAWLDVRSGRNEAVFMDVLPQ